MDGQEAAQITVTVLSARQLQSRRKGEVCLASVVFGVGKDCYMTETIQSDSPEWNQEAKVNLPQRNHSTEVKFKVRDKDHTLGVATIPISSLSKQREVSKRWLPLTPHKKSHEAHGEILVECFVSDARPGVSRSEKASPNTSLTNSQEDLHTSHKGGGVVRGVKDRFSFHHRRNPSWTKTRTSSTPTTPSPKRLSGSDLELHWRQNKVGGLASDTSVRMASSPEHRGGEQSGDSVRSSVFENPLMPEVTGISPKEGPVEGGQRVVLRGSCLGECKSDVVRVVIADVDCTETLEYLSPAKLVVTTLPCTSPNSGPVVVETVRGGVGESSLTFTYIAGDSTGSNQGVTIKKENSFSKPKKPEVDPVEFKAMKQQLRDLKEDNARLKNENNDLRSYIDQLLLTIMEAKPDILEVRPTPAVPITQSRSSLLSS